MIATLLTAKQSGTQPALRNAGLDYVPMFDLCTASDIGGHVAHKLLCDLENQADADHLYLTLKALIGVDLPSQSMASLRTFARAIQLALIGGAA